MQRCLELAIKGAGMVAPNPMVGAVLVHDGKIIGEGWHEKYGEAHAEANCINQAIQNGAKELIAQSVLYVSLEPCAHHGKTPPCADLIIRHKIPKVIIGCSDPFKEVDGKGIDKLKQAGVEVEVGILEKECIEINKRFYTFHIQHRPYVILKWAQSADGFIGTGLNESLNGSNAPRLLISNSYSNRLVHQWRSEEAAILVGTNTALLDNPELTTRLVSGPSPIRMVIDMNLRLPHTLKLFNQQERTIVFNLVKQEESNNIMYYKVTYDVSVVQQVVDALYQMKIQSVLVEGGAQLLQSFIDEGVWDEVRIITNTQLKADTGLPAPVLEKALKTTEEKLVNDNISYFKQK